MYYRIGNLSEIILIPFPNAFLFCDNTNCFLIIVHMIAKIYFKNISIKFVKYLINYGTLKSYQKVRSKIRFEFTCYEQATFLPLST